MFSYTALADFIIFLHAIYVAFVIIGFILITLGGWLQWQWVRNVWFRIIHLLAILFVCLESLLHATCPLTTLEKYLRHLDGQAVYQQDFIGFWLDRLLFYHLPHYIFLIIYMSFGLAVAALFYFVPLRRN